MLARLSTLGILFMIALLACSCISRGEDGDSHKPDDSDDDVDDDLSSDDDEDDDTGPGDDDILDDDTSDDDNDDDTGDDDDGPASWCRSIGTLPEDSNWQWTTRVMGRVPEGDFESWLAFDGDTLWVNWTQWDATTESRAQFLSRYELGTWTDFPLFSEPDAPVGSHQGLTVDLQGRPWTTFLDWEKVISPVALNLLRWEDGEIAEILPVDDIGITQFYKLFTLPDGRFLIYFHYGIPRTIYQADTGFVMSYPNMDTNRYVPDSNGVMHAFGVAASYLLIHDSGSDVQPYQMDFAGLMPQRFNPAMGVPWTAVDSAFGLHFIGFLDDYRIWHQWTDGTGAQSEAWSNSLEGCVCPHYIGGVDIEERPFISFGICSGNPPVTCFVRQENGDLRSEVMEAAELYGQVEIYNDFALSESSQIAFSAVLGEWDGVDTTSRSLKVFVREPSTR